MLLYGILYNLIQSFDYIYDGVEHESPNVLMFFLYAFTSEHVAYYGVLFVFALIVADVVYEEYLTKNIFLLYKTRKKVVFGMIKIVAVFSAIFLFAYIFLILVMAWNGNIPIDFHYTRDAIQNWGSMQLWHHLREASVYLPVSVLNYNEFVVLLLVFLKYYIGLVLLAMIGLIFSIRKDSVQYGSLAMLIVILFNLAMLEYDGPWNFYGIGISVDLSKIFRYISLQRYFIFEFADIKYDVMRIFAETYVQGAIWFLFLFGILYQMFERRDL